MRKGFFAILSFLLLSHLAFGAQGEENPPSLPVKKGTPKVSSFTPFTGKIVGEKVRMRIQPTLESDVICELNKGDYMIITGQKGDFYQAEPPSELKAYVFRGFVIDGIIEGDRVNVRLAPNREAPIIGRYNKGTRIPETIAPNHSKWFEIPIPKNTRFYISKEYIERAGDAEFKKIHDKRKVTVEQLLESAHLFSRSELHKTFPEINIEKAAQNYELIIDEYADFPIATEKATKALAQLREDYLYRKIAFLENKGKLQESSSPNTNTSSSSSPTKNTSPSDRMKVWEPIEEGLYLSWAEKHHDKSATDFYKEEKLKATIIHGFLEPYNEPIKNKPGDFMVKSQGIPLAYVYSTHVNLEKYIGKEVTLTVSSRPNNHFAFPAFYVLSVE